MNTDLERWGSSPPYGNFVLGDPTPDTHPFGAWTAMKQPIVIMGAEIGPGALDGAQAVAISNRSPHATNLTSILCYVRCKTNALCQH